MSLVISNIKFWSSKARNLLQNRLRLDSSGHVRRQLIGFAKKTNKSVVLKSNMPCRELRCSSSLLLRRDNQFKTDGFRHSKKCR